MSDVVARIGRPPEEYRYECCALEREGFLSVYSFRVPNHMPNHDLMYRDNAVVVLPADFSARELYMIMQPRHIRAFIETDAGSAALANARKGGTSQEFTLPAARVNTLEAPAGIIDGDETAEATAMRELREETGIAVPEASLIKVAAYYPSVGASTEFTTAFIARLDTEGVAFEPADGDGNEHITVLKMRWDEAFDLLDRGEIRTASCNLLLRELRLMDLREKKG